MASPAAELKGNLPVITTMTAFMGISWYISVELLIRLVMIFKRRSGLYFWSCCISAWSILLQPLFMVLYNFGVVKNAWVALTLLYISWAMMIQGQSYVLYSRLHLMVQNRMLLRCVLGMIITTGVGIAIPTIVIGLVRIEGPNLVMDKIQVATFFVQEGILSGIYVYHIRKYLKSTSILSNDKKVRPVMRHLLWVQLMVIFFDISIVVLSYIPGIFYVQATLKPCVYGIKLRVEFSVLNRLVETIKSSQPWSTDSNDPSSSKFVDSPSWVPSVWQTSQIGPLQVESISGSRPLDIPLSKTSESTPNQLDLKTKDLEIGITEKGQYENAQNPRITVSTSSKDLNEITPAPDIV
ncbi:hypothetical protein P154DRAFT_526367 [Amniculicola lignicola CBS 123094]|uniref:DUF7703 domain-containing protein n=1 Tax=Amniculicola lignicola CBS 123094 TaxID=1392246 RepID=A0A6A5W2I8_9PLEO|nr:hypothetical protein P154DRAFT_526367 [Amniculicola lignicola CBS 123094]